MYFPYCQSLSHKSFLEIARVKSDQLKIYFTFRLHHYLVPEDFTESVYQDFGNLSGVFWFNRLASSYNIRCEYHLPLN
jgi:hypothetical protein